jgi:2-octaprenylphenol hydroxylase
MNEAYQVVVVGSGAVGATLACFLARSGVHTALVEAREPAAFDPEEVDLRVFAVSRATQRVWSHLGAWDSIAACRVSPYRAMEVWDARGRGRIHFDAAELGEPDLGHIVENRLIQATLFELAQSLDTLDVYCPATPEELLVDDGGAALTLADGRVLQSQLVVAADGARSRIRELAGIDVRSQAYGQQALVAHVRTEIAHGETARQVFLPEGPLAFLPLADGRCSIVWSADDARAEALRALDEAEFLAELTAASEGVLGQIVETTQRVGFPLAAAHAQHYVQPRIALIGDAAHTVHPLAGQGVNLGVLDAAALAEVLASGDDLGELALLRRYERWRRGENLAMQTAFSGFKLLFGTRLPLVPILRSAGLGLVDRMSPVKNAFMRRAMGLEGDLPASARAVTSL